VHLIDVSKNNTLVAGPLRIASLLLALSCAYGRMSHCHCDRARRNVVALPDKLMNVCRGQQEKPRASAKPTRDVSPSVTKQQQQQQQQPSSSSSSSSSPPQRASQPAQLTTNVDASQQRFLQQLQARDARFVS